MTPFEYEAELAALREELAAVKKRNADMLNWLRRQANAEKDPTVRATFIEAHNALKQIAKEVRNDAV